MGIAMKQSQSTRTGSGQAYFIDLLGYEDLQLLKAKRDYSTQSAQPIRNNKKYLIVTVLLGANNDKVHYPLPLNPVETGAFLMDKDTMKRMVSRMSQTLTEFKSMNNT